MPINYQEQIKSQYADFCEEDKASVIKIIRNKLNTYIMSDDANTQEIYHLWVSKQKRGICRFLFYNANSSRVEVISHDEVFKFFTEYLNQCAKNGIDPRNTNKGGRPRKC